MALKYLLFVFNRPNKDPTRKELAKKDGIFAEITSAAIFSGLEKLIKQKNILPDDDVLLPITGFGLKDPPKDLFN